MKVTAINSYQYNSNLGNNKVNPKQNTYSKPQKPINNSPSFGMFVLDDIYNWSVRRANKYYLEQAAAQVNTMRRESLNDIELLTKRHGVSKKTVEEQYGKAIARGGIPPRYNGNETGLNRIVGYSMEKFEILKRVIVPILDTAEAAKAGKESAEINTPNGIIFYGRPHAGKKYLSMSILEHLNYKAKLEELPIKTYMVSEDWWQGGTEKNINTLRSAFQEARKNSEKGEYTVMFIDNLNDIMTAKQGNLLRMELFQQTHNDPKEKVTWIGTIDDVRDLNRQLFRQNRVDMFMEIDKPKSEGESLALLKHFIAETGRATNMDENYISGYIRNSKIPALPGKIKEIVDFADDELSMSKDYHTKKWGKHVEPIHNQPLMMGADYVSKYNRNRVILPYEKKHIQIPQKLIVNTRVFPTDNNV